MAASVAWEWKPNKRASVDRPLLCLDRSLGGCGRLRVNWSHRRSTGNTCEHCCAYERVCVCLCVAGGGGQVCSTRQDDTEKSSVNIDMRPKDTCHVKHLCVTTVMITGSNQMS